jgi:hypothetical protein
MAQQPSSRWFQQPMLWLFVSLLGITVVCCFALMWVAAKTDDGLVSDHYYEDGQAIGKEFKRDALANTLNLSAQVMMGEDGRKVHVLLMPASQQPDRMQLRFAHPTQAGLDQVVSLVRDAGGMYVGNLPQSLAPHRWLVQLEAQGWRMQSEAVVSAAGVVDLKPLKH